MGAGGIMNVVVSNTVLANGGDAAILLGLLRAVSRELGPDTSFTLLDSHPALVDGRYPELNVEAGLPAILAERAEGYADNAVVRRIRRALDEARVRARFPGSAAGALLRPTGEFLEGWIEHYRQADAVISTGGTYLVDAYRLTPRLLELEAAVRMGKPLVLYTQSVGPLRSRAAQRAVRRVLRYARLVLVRDRTSADLLTRIGVPADRVVTAADAAFGLPGERIRRLGAGRDPFRGSSSPRVAVSVRRWPYFHRHERGGSQEAYRAAVAACIRHLVTRYQAEVTLVSTCQGLPGYGFDDAAEAAAVHDALPADLRDQVVVDGRFHRPEELVDVLSQHDLTVATRMHAAILSLVGGTPVVPIAYERKTRDLFHDLGAADLLVDIHGITAGQLIAAADRLIHDYPGRSAALEPGILKAQRSALAVPALVRKRLLPQAGSN